MSLWQVSRACSIVLALLGCLLFVPNARAAGARIHFTEFRLPTNCGNAKNGGCAPGALARGTDGALWFVEMEGKRIGRITTDGKIQEFPVPVFPYHLVFGPDGNVWFTDSASHIGRMTLQGQTTLFEVPTDSAGLSSITVGPDNNLWFTEQGGNAVGKITLDGEITEYPLAPPSNGPRSIISGFDSNLWFTMFYTNKIAKMTVNGEITEYLIPNSEFEQCGSSCFPDSLTRDLDGRMWFAETGRNWVSYITITGEFQQFDLGPSSVYPNSMRLTLGPGGAIWFADENERLGTITPRGKFKIYPLELECGARQCGMGSIAWGPDLNVWFTEWHGNQIGRLQCEPRLQSPPNGARLGQARVTFKWESSPCARHYGFEVRQDSPQGKIVHYAKYVKGNQIKFDLARGHDYYWFVSACGWSCKSETGMFSIVARRSGAE
ncbi:MAG: hypothetical protein HY741_28565 [Chloroflexi bacterium]|nr:hypothetical protein [Chloroflexota bacterium]